MYDDMDFFPNRGLEYIKSQSKKNKIAQGDKGIFYILNKISSLFEK